MIYLLVIDMKKILKPIISLIISNIIPALVGLTAVPQIINNIGMARFGIYSITLVIFGLMSFLDLGITKGITRQISTNGYEYSRVNESANIAIFFSVLMSFVFSLCLVLYKLIYPDLELDFFFSLMISFLSIPVIVLGNVYRSIFEGVKNFSIISFNRVFMGVWVYLVPLLITYFNNNVWVITLSLSLGRFISLLMFHYKNTLNFTFNIDFSFKTKGNEAFIFGLGVTASNVINPIMMYFERIMIGHFVGAIGIGQYSAPMELTQRATILSNICSSVLFPYLSSYNRELNRKKLFSLVLFSTLIISFIYFLFYFLISQFSRDIIYFWLGESNELIADLLVLLSFSVFCNAVGYIPFSFIHSLGKSIITAKLHFIEFIFYMPLCAFLVFKYSLLGAAYSLIIRNTFDSLLLIILTFISFKSYEKNNI